MEQENKTAEPSSLLDRAAAMTENKEAPIASPPSPTGTGAENFWGSEEDMDIPPQPAPEAQKAAQDPQSPAQPAQPSSAAQIVAPIAEKPVSANLQKLSAINAVGMIDFTNRVLITPIVNWKAKKQMQKLNPDLEELEALVDANEADLDEDEKRQRKAFDRILKKLEKTQAAIPLTDKEKQEGIDTFKEYFVHTGKSLPPEMMIWFFIANTTGKRAVDTFFS